MTFGAMPAWYAWLLVGGAAALAAWLFLLKLRPPRVFVPSLLLWRRVLDDSRERTLWERIRRAVSLAATVLIAMTLAFAVARPSRSSPGGAAGSPGRTIIVVDSSWSMLARTRSGETRWDRAVAEARRLADAAAGHEVALATTADGFVEGPTADRALIDAALDRISPAGDDPTSWPAPVNTRPATTPDTVHFITDGAVARPLQPAVILHSVFEPAANVGITAFDVRPSLTGVHAGDAYLELANFAAAGQQVRITLTRGAASVMDRKVDLGAGESLRQILPIARGGDPVLRARVDADEDALGIDDEAFAWIDRARPLSVTVVGEQTAWLTPLFAGGPGIRVTVLDPSAYPGGTRGADVILFDRWAPPDPPARPALYIAPPFDTPWLADTEGRPPAPREEPRPQWDTPGSHPVVRGVDPFTLTIERARSYSSPGLVPVARSARGTPLVYVHESRERRFVVVTFGAGESNLASAPGFPVLIGNALEWLVPPGGPARKPGAAAFDGVTDTVTGPRGTAVPLGRVGRTAIGVLRSPGLYVVEGGGARATLVVNVGSPEVSNLTRTTFGDRERAHMVTEGGSVRPFWIYCALAAFILALVEWWTWQRRITV
jgi:hypothetical protein